MDQIALGKRIKAARERVGMTQEDLAAAVDYSVDHVSVVERGVKPPKLEKLVAIANVLTYVSYGLPYMEFVRKISVTWFAPMLQLLNRVGFHPGMKEAGDDYYCIKYTFRGTNTIVVYVIAAAVIYFISYKIYKHRDLENAGSFIAIPKLKPVFRWVLGCLGGLILSTVTASLLLGLRISIGVPAIMMLAVVLGIIAFLLLEMIIRKNFKIFSKALFKEIIAFGGFVVVVFGGITVYGNVQENYIPKLADMILPV